MKDTIIQNTSMSAIELGLSGYNKQVIISVSDFEVQLSVMIVKREEMKITNEVVEKSESEKVKIKYGKGVFTINNNSSKSFIMNKSKTINLIIERLNKEI